MQAFCTHASFWHFATHVTWAGSMLKAAIVHASAACPVLHSSSCCAVWTLRQPLTIVCAYTADWRLLGCGVVLKAEDELAPLQAQADFEWKPRAGHCMTCTVPSRPCMHRYCMLRTTNVPLVGCFLLVIICIRSGLLTARAAETKSG